MFLQFKNYLEKLSLKSQLLLVSLFFLPALVEAHTRWFADGDLAPYISSEPTTVYLTCIGVVALIVVLLASMFERCGLFKMSWLKPKSPRAFLRASATFSMITGAFFMIAGTHGFLFSPNLSHDVGVPIALSMSQFAIGLMLVLGIFARVAGFLLIALWFLGIHYSGLEAMIEDIWVLSIATFIIVMGNDYFSITSIRAIKPMVEGFKDYALPILRLGTGATLLVLGFSEKILRPELGLNFLAKHDWNFMYSSGFSDYLFVLSAGAVESLLGLLFILGVLTRLTALVTIIIFFAPLFILGPLELTGHLPHFIAIFILLLFGPGKHFRLFHKREV